MDFATFFVRTLADICFNKPPTHATKDIWKQINKEQLEKNSAKITQCVLKEMYCENTGSHICDSGGAYGYGYQESQAIKDQDWMKMSPIHVEIDKYSDGKYWINITKNSYLILCDALEYDLEMDKIFHRFCESERTFEFEHRSSHYIPKGSIVNGETVEEGYHDKKEWTEYFKPKKESYYACMNAFVKGHLKYLKEAFGFEDYEYMYNHNTYNGDSCLDKTLQWVCFRINNGKFEGEYIILQIHNGCDVRGGYSTPHVFRFEEDDFYWRLEDLTCRCPNYDYNYTDKVKGVQKNLKGESVKDPIVDLEHVDC